MHVRTVLADTRHGRDFQMTNIVNFMKRHPALTYGLIGLIAAGVVWVADVQYDSSGIVGALYWGVQNISIAILVC